MKNNELFLLDKEYDMEALYDVGREVIESFDPKFNPIAGMVDKYYPQDKNGFNEAIYRVRISVEIPNGND